MRAMRRGWEVGSSPELPSVAERGLDDDLPLVVFVESLSDVALEEDAVLQTLACRRVLDPPEGDVVAQTQSVVVRQHGFRAQRGLRERVLVDSGEIEVRREVVE